MTACLLPIALAHDPPPDPVLVSYLGIGFDNPPDIVNITANHLATGYITHLNLAFFAFNSTGHVVLPNTCNGGRGAGRPDCNDGTVSVGSTLDSYT